MKGFFRFASVMAVLTGLLSVSSLAETSPYDAARVLRVTMKDGSTRLFLAEHVDSITFKADLKDSSGIGSPDKFKEANLKLVDFVEYNHLQAVFDGVDGEIPMLLGDDGDEMHGMYFGALSYAKNGSVARIKGDWTVPDTIRVHEDITINKVFFEREFVTGSYSTLFLPFDIEAGKVHGVKFYALNVQKSDGTWKVVASRVSSKSKIKAYTPYLIEATGPVMTFDGPVTFKKTVRNNLSFGDWEVRGVYCYSAFGDFEEGQGKLFDFAVTGEKEPKVGEFVLAGKDDDIYPLQAYLVYSGKKSSMPKTLDVEIVENTMVVGRGSINTRTGAIRLDNWYDLQGRKLKGKPNTKGTYYHNAKRVIVK